MSDWNEAIDLAAKTAEKYGCGKPGCTDCYAGAAAVEIRSLKRPAEQDGLAKAKEALKEIANWDNHYSSGELRDIAREALKALEGE